MIASEPTEFTYKGQPATMRVFRNDGYCWGRIVTAKGEQLDVNTRRDYYDYDDDYVLDAFIRAAKRPSNVDAAIGWLEEVEEA